MADDPDLVVSYSVDPPGLATDTVRLPQVSRRMTRDEVLLARGTADALALRHRYHDPATAARYAPTGAMARDLMDAMESARCEAVGARDMPGTAGNIDAKYRQRRPPQGLRRDPRGPPPRPLATAAGYPDPAPCHGPRPAARGRPNVMELWRGYIEDRCGGTLEDLEVVMKDQSAFARFARRMIDDLGYGDQLGDDPDEMDDEGEDEGTEDQQEESPESTGEDDSQEDDAEASPERSQEQQQDAAQAQVDMDDSADMEEAEQQELPEGEAPLEPPPPARPFRGRPGLYRLFNGL